MPEFAFLLCHTETEVATGLSILWHTSESNRLLKRKNEGQGLGSIHQLLIELGYKMWAGV